MPESLLKYYSQPFEVYSYILEDDEDDATEVEEIFKRHPEFGKYDRFTRGTELVRTLDDVRVDLFIADFKGIDLDGLEAMRRVKEKYPRCYFILMTQFVTNEVIDQAVNDIGIKHYIDKRSHNCFQRLEGFIADGVNWVRDDFAFIQRIGQRIEKTQQRGTL